MNILQLGHEDKVPDIDHARRKTRYTCLGNMIGVESTRQEAALDLHSNSHKIRNSLQDGTAGPLCKMHYN